MSTLDFSEPQHLIHRFDEKPLTTTALRFMKHGGIELSGAEYDEAGVAALRDALTARLERVAAKRAAHDEKRRAACETLRLPDLECKLMPAHVSVRDQEDGVAIGCFEGGADIAFDDLPKVIAKLQSIHEFYAPKEAQ